MPCGCGLSAGRGGPEAAGGDETEAFGRAALAFGAVALGEGFELAVGDGEITATDEVAPDGDVAVAARQIRRRRRGARSGEVGRAAGDGAQRHLEDPFEHRGQGVLGVRGRAGREERQGEEREGGGGGKGHGRRCRSARAFLPGVVLREGRHQVAGMDAFPPGAAVRLSAARVFGTMAVAVAFAWPLPAPGRLAGIAALLLIAAAISGMAALWERRPVFGDAPTRLDEGALFLLMAMALGWIADRAALRLLLAGP